MRPTLPPAHRAYGPEGTVNSAPTKYRCILRHRLKESNPLGYALGSDHQMSQCSLVVCHPP